MKLCYVITRFSGGAGDYVEALAREMEKEHQVTIVCGPDSNLEKLEKMDVGYRVEKFLVHLNPLFLLLSFFTLYTYFKKESFEIIHTNSTEAGWVGRIAGKIAGSKVVHTNHAVPFEERRPRLLYVWAERISAFFSDILINVSSTIREKFEDENVGRGKHKVVTLGIDIKMFKDVKETKLPGGNFKVVTVSRLVKKKGLEKIIEVARESSKMSFLIVGDGPLKESLERKASDLENVHFLGYRSDVENILNSSDVFLLLSEREGTPIVIYEAMAAGLPIISTDIGGIRDQVKGNGFLVSNLEEAIEDLQELREDTSLRKEMEEKSVNLSQDFTKESMISSTRKVYESLNS